MTEIINRAWELLDVAVSQAKDKDEKVALNDAARDAFANSFKEKYNLIKDKFMKQSVKYLDRHKVAGIIIASIVETNAVIYEGEIPPNSIFFGKYLIAFSVGMSYMQSRLNKMLKEKRQKEIERFYFPTPFSCKTPYNEIFSRNLYYTYEFTDWNLNLLDISEILFLLEYITLEKNGIDPVVLSENV